LSCAQEQRQRVNRLKLVEVGLKISREGETDERAGPAVFEIFTASPGGHFRTGLVRKPRPGLCARADLKIFFLRLLLFKAQPSTPLIPSPSPLTLSFLSLQCILLEIIHNVVEDRRCQPGREVLYGHAGKVAVFYCSLQHNCDRIAVSIIDCPARLEIIGF